MTEKFDISDTCTIKAHKVILNDVLVYQEDTSAELLVFLKNTYKHFNTDYAKYFKMDTLCKLGFLCADILLKNLAQHHVTLPETTAIILSNRNSSLYTDLKYHETIKDPSNYFPSPALFVYTLPNIVIGEIAIKHKLKGENYFFIKEVYGQEFLENYAEMLFNESLAEAALIGWVEIQGQDYEAAFSLLQKNV